MQYTITLTRGEVEKLLCERLAKSFDITIETAGGDVEYTVTTNISSNINYNMTENWRPQTQIESDCESIIRAACEAVGVTFEEVRSTRRLRRIADARRIIAAECYKKIGYRYGTEKIGQMLGRDHSTVVYFKNNFDSLMSDRGFYDMYQLYLGLKKEYDKEVG